MKVYVGKRIHRQLPDRCLDWAEVEVQERSIGHVFAGESVMPGAITERIDSVRALPEDGPDRQEPNRSQGYEWGYGGTGPAHLARCILWDHLGYDPAPALYQLFKEAFLVSASPEGFTIHEDEITSWLGALTKNRSVG